MPQQKTYWHLLQQKRMPTEYEIVTSKLLLYTGEGFTGKRFELDVPLQQAVRHLDAGEGRPVVPLGQRVRPGDEPGGRIGDADVEDLPRADLVVEGAHGLPGRGVAIPHVHPVDVDIAGAQPAQARFQ